MDLANCKATCFPQRDSSSEVAALQLQCSVRTVKVSDHTQGRGQYVSNRWTKGAPAAKLPRVLFYILPFVLLLKLMRYTVYTVSWFKYIWRLKIKPQAEYSPGSLWPAKYLYHSYLLKLEKKMLIDNNLHTHGILVRPIFISIGPSCFPFVFLPSYVDVCLI